MMKYGVHGAPHDVIKICNFCNKIFTGFWSTGGQNFRSPIDFADYRYNSAHCAACDNRNRLLLGVGKHRYSCLFLVFLKTVGLCIEMDILTYWLQFMFTVRVNAPLWCRTCRWSAHYIHYCLQTDCLVLLTQETSQMSSVRFHSSIQTAMDLNLDFFVWCLHYPQMKH